MSQPIEIPFTVFTDIDGQPLENGYLYLGTAGLDPATNAVTVYSDAALTTTIAQPIRTTGGYPMNSGSPTNLYVNADDYSLAVKNKNNTLVNQDLNAGKNGGVNAGLTGSVSRSLTAKIFDIVSVKDFGAVGDGVTDDSAAVQAAITSVSDTAYATASSPTAIYFPSGIYNIDTSITHDGDYIKVYGDGYKSAIKWSGSNDTAMFNFNGNLGGGVFFENLSFDCQNLTCTAIQLGESGDTTEGFGHQVTIRGCQFRDSVEPSSGGAAVIDSFNETHNGRIEQCWFLNCDNTAIGLNRTSGVSGAPVNWVIDNNEFQQIDGLCLFSVEPANIMVSSNSIDNDGVTGTDDAGFEVDGAIQVYFLNNYAESLSQFMFAISEAAPNDATESCSAVITGNTGNSCGAGAYTDVMLGATFEARDVQIYGNTWLGPGNWLTVGAAAKRTLVGHNVYATDLVGTVVEQRDGITGAGEWLLEGQYESASLAAGSAISLTTTTAANVTSMTLPAGDWDVTGYVEFSGGSATTVAYAQASISETSATLGAAFQTTSVDLQGNTVLATVNYSMNCPATRITVASGSTTTVYLIARASFGVSTCTAFGKIQARIAKGKVT